MKFLKIVCCDGQRICFDLSGGKSWSVDSEKSLLCLRDECNSMIGIVNISTIMWAYESKEESEAKRIED